MDAELEREIEETVIAILKTADMHEMTEAKVRKLASEKLGVDLSAPDCKKFVRGVVEAFLQTSNEEEQEQEGVTEKKDEEEPKEEEEEAKEEEEEEEEEEEGGGDGKEYDDNGDLIICRLSNRRRVTLQDFRGKTLISIREYYEKDGKELPSSKGISLTPEQWSMFSKAVPKIEESIKKISRG